MPTDIPHDLLDNLKLADPSWRPVLRAGLEAIAKANPDYLPDLARDTYLPTQGRMFAAFAQPLAAVRFVLVGEGPYPRAHSATGVCFMDGAVDELWSEQGLSKPVNRATSLRNFMKMLLVTDGELKLGETSGAAVALVAAKARVPGSHFIQTRAELQDNLMRHGFLLLNATLVYRPHVPPLKEARPWLPFLQVVLDALAGEATRENRAPPTLVLWGKVAEALSAVPANALFPKTVSEHPYNLSFIANQAMHALFGPMRLLHRPHGVL